MPTTFNRLALFGYLTAPLCLLALWLSFDLSATAVAPTRKERLIWMTMQGIGFSGPLIWFYLRSGKSGNLTKVHLYLIALYAWMAVATVLAAIAGVSPSLRGSTIEFILAFWWMSIFWAVNGLVSSEELFRFMMRTIRIGGLVITSSVYAGLILYRTLGIEFGEVIAPEDSNFFRCFGPLGDHVAFIIVLFVLAALVRSSRLEAAFHIGAIVITSTRGAMISVLVGFVWLVFNGTDQKSRSRRLPQALAMLAVMLVAAFAYGLSSAGETSAARILDTSLVAHGAGTRLAAFQLAIDVLIANPIFGTGWGGFRDQWMNYADVNVLGLDGDTSRMAFYTQNQLLQFGTDGGIPGMVLYTLFSIALLRESRRVLTACLAQDQEALRGLDAYLAAMIIGNQSAVWFTSYSSSGFFVMLAAAAVLGYGTISRKTIAPVRLGQPLPGDRFPIRHNAPN